MSEILEYRGFGRGLGGWRVESDRDFGGFGW